MSDDAWYFARTQLAEQYFKVFDVGISSSLAIIAPRRKGKTLFLLNDVASLAKKHGYYPVYMSLWEDMNSPEKGVIKALQKAIDDVDNKSLLRKSLAKKLRKVAIGNELIGRVEVEFADKPQQASSEALLVLDDLLTELETKSKLQVLLLVDEVQHLATAKQFYPLSHTLRTLLDKRQGSIKAIFTGSSRHYMHVLLGESKSPFFHFPEMVPFPDLGQGFLRFLIKKLQQRHGVSVTEKKISTMFHALNESPYWMMKCISHMVSYSVSVKDALEYTLQLMDAMNGFDRLEQCLRPIDKLVFLALCDRRDPFSLQIFQEIEEKTDLKGIAGNVQQSLKRLMAHGLVSQLRKGEYEIEKPGFGAYLSKEHR